MAKNLEEALTNIENQIGGDGRKFANLGEHLEYIENQIGGDGRKFANLGEHLEYIEKLLGEGGGSGGSGGSGKAIEVDELPSLQDHGTVIPNQGTINRIYINNKMSKEDVESLLRPLCADLGGVGIAGDNSSFVLFAQIESDNLAIIYAAESIIEIYNSQDGWSLSFQGFIEFNNAVTLVSESDGLPVGNYNDQLTSLFSSTPFVAPNIEEETIYKLPDETLWMFKNGKWKQLGGKIPPTSFGSYNNPDFGFYIGQTFGFDDPITFDIPMIISKMTESGLTRFEPIEGWSAPFIIRIPVIDTYAHSEEVGISMDILICIFSRNTDSETVEITIKTNNSYAGLDTSYTTGVNDSFTFTLRELYQKCYASDTSKLDALFNVSSVKYGYISPQEFVSSTCNLNNPENAFYKFLKIGN